MQVHKILASGAFAGSDPVRHLLLYLAEHGVRRPGESVKELELATQALGRGAGYDPRTDSSGRVTASRVRTKLLEYYSQQGARDPIVVSIPKGSYSLVATYRAPETPSAEPPPPAPPVVVPPKRSRREILLTCSGLLAGGLAGYLTGHRSMQASVPKVSSIFWRDFLADGDPIIVYSNPVFVGRPEEGMHLLHFGAGSQTPANALFTGAGEVVAVRDVARQLNALGREPRVKRAQLFTWDDARSGDLIFVGGQQQNLPMSQLPPLEKLNLKPDTEEPYRLRGAVHVEKPGAGEKEYYFSDPNPEEGLEYAVIAFTNGVTSDRRVLILAGIHTFGTQGAAEFVCNPTSLAQLLKRLDVKDGAPLPKFEALIEFRMLGGSPLDPRILLVHKRA